MPFVIQGFALSFRSLTGMFFNGACFAMVELTVVMKDPKDFLFITITYLKNCISVPPQFVLTTSLSKLFLLSFLKS